jgi:hypothetical protein
VKFSNVHIILVYFKFKGSFPHDRECKIAGHFTVISTPGIKKNCHILKFERTGEKAVGTNLKIRSWLLPTEMEENHPEGQ